MNRLKMVDAKNLPRRGEQVYDTDTLNKVRVILNDIKSGGENSIRYYAEKFGDIATGQKLFIPQIDLKSAFDDLPADDQSLLKRVASRIRLFAEAQKESLKSLSVPIAGGHVGHDILPVETAGCYAPGGRFPLPSSVLMTAIPARVAGVKNVIVASPRPTRYTLAAAYLAGVDGVLCIGGAQAIGVLAYGACGFPPADIIVGPGNRWVTAAKQIISGSIGIDMLAGPSELMIVADDSADAKIIAADLLAQAEHDPDALPVMVSLSKDLIDSVNTELEIALAALPDENRATAEPALSNGYAVYVEDINQAIEIANTHAPEHLELILKDAKDIAPSFKECGGLFIGHLAAEVIGDYGVGPNHTLPTGGTARHKAGLSVFNFLRIRTWINIDDQTAAQNLYADAARLGRIEGLEGHARSAEARLLKCI
jgi:phosphoribosyl-ATP pyrophosphohydrolase/phosphoribosyl-AMP cyclohydrolase/histidinol dehydrogenase